MWGKQGEEGLTPVALDICNSAREKKGLGLTSIEGPFGVCDGSDSFLVNKLKG